MLTHHPPAEAVITRDGRDTVVTCGICTDPASTWVGRGAVPVVTRTAHNLNLTRLLTTLSHVTQTIISLQLNCASLSEKSLARVLFFGGMCAFVVWCRSGAAAVQVLVLFLLGAGVRIKFGTFNQPRPLPSPIRRTIGGVALATAPGPFRRSRIISTGCLFVFLCCPSPTSPARINIVARGPVGAGCWQSYDLAWRLALL